MHDIIKLLSTKETAALLHRAERTIQSWGQRWIETACETGDPHLPSSLSNGLRRSGSCSGRALHDLRDIEEHVENTIREEIGHPLQNWRKEACHDIA